MGAKILGIGFLHQSITAVFLVSEDAADSTGRPEIVPHWRLDTLFCQCGGEAAETMQRAQNLHILNWGVGTTELAVKLYRLLRRCDKLGVGIIFSEGVTEDGIGLAVMNRMRKAAGRQVLTAADIEALLKNSTQLKSFVLK